jgi:hypothetical protein
LEYAPVIIAVGLWAAFPLYRLMQAPTSTTTRM